MRFWILAVLEEGCNCQSCGRRLNIGELAYILIDTNEIPVRYEWMDCSDCHKVKFPNWLSALIG